MVWIDTPQSSNVKRHSYDSAQLAMTVEFHVHTHKDGTTPPPSIYRFSPVTQAFYDLLFVPGNSVGKIINDLRFDHGVTIERVDPDDDGSAAAEAAWQEQCAERAMASDAGLVFATEEF